MSLIVLSFFANFLVISPDILAPKYAPPKVAKIAAKDIERVNLSFISPCKLNFHFKKL